MIATGLTRNATNDVDAKKQRTVATQHVAPSVAAQNQATDEDDIPAISKRTGTEAGSAPTATPRSSPMSIQDYLQKQQRK